MSRTAIDDLSEFFHLSTAGETKFANANGMIVAAVSFGATGWIISFRDGFENDEDVRRYASCASPETGELSPEVVLDLSGSTAYGRSISYRSAVEPCVRKRRWPLRKLVDELSVDRFAGAFFAGERISVWPTQSELAARKRSFRFTSVV